MIQRRLGLILTTAVITGVLWLPTNTFGKNPTLRGPSLLTGLPDYLSKIAQAECDVATARLALANQRLNALQRLHQKKHASFRELVNARIESSTLASQQSSANRFVQEVRDFTASPEFTPQDTQSIVIIPIPGMQDDSTLRILGHVVLELPQWFPQEQLNVPTSPDADPMTAPAAWKSLLDRLEEINDDSLAFEKEKQIVELKYKLARAEQAVMDFDASGPHICRGGDTRRAELLLCQAFAASDGLRHLAISKSSKDARALIEQLHQRIERAAEHNASPARELPIVNQRMEFYAHQHENAESVWASITSDPVMNHQGHTFVTSSRFASEARRIGVASIQLNLAATAALDRMVAAAEYVAVKKRELNRLQVSLKRLANLAEKEPYFETEHQRSLLKTNLVSAELEKAKFDHEASALVHEYVVARISSTTQNRIGWNKPLIKLFQRHANSVASEQYATAALADAQWRIDALTQLKKTGATTWKEITGANVRRSQFQQALRQAKHNRKLAQSIHKLLVESTQKDANAHSASHPEQG